MRILPAGYNCKLGCFAVILSCCFISSPQLAAQNNDTPGKTSTQKATKVFYGQASYYANKFNGRRTASGEIFDQKKLTCACNVLPLGTLIKVTNLRNRRTVTVKVNDRIHPKMKRVVDLSRAAAEKLGFISGGLTRVKVEVVGKKAIPWR
ncbi:MAG: septal ring lytic transglycosylase RlpA family protein [Ferruginibacter sp.]|nr:septal ring lytic transglycosylase RlpA family protein [Ferruginibacter sp.]